jgi:Tfp pilus assembly protein PilX
MKKKIKKINNVSRFTLHASRSEGSALAYALVIMLAVMVILTSLIGYIVSQLNYSSSQVERQEALEIAEAGVYWYNWYLAHETDGKTAQQINNFWQGTSPNPLGVGSPYQQTFTAPDGQTLGSYSLAVQRPSPGSTIVMVTSTGWTNQAPSAKRTVQVRFRRPSWSEYAVLANDVMRFGQGTVINGKIQSNYGIRMDGTAYNVVSSSVASYDDPDHSGPNEYGVHTHLIAPADTSLADPYLNSEVPTGSNPTPPDRPDVFKAGRQFPVPTVSFTGVTSNLAYMKTQAQSSGVYFSKISGTGGERIIFNNNGTFNACAVYQYDTNAYSINNYYQYSSHNHVYTCSTCSGACMHTYAIPNGGVIYVENNAWVEGSINGQRVTVVAANLIGGASPDIYLGMNNLTYTNFNGNDIIGLVAQNNISVVENSQNYLTIDGALLAQNGRVGRNWYSSMYNKNTITVNGSIATNQRYGFAYTDGTGYANRILNFDNNLIYYPPPYFPTGTEYAIDLWQEL